MSQPLTGIIRRRWGDLPKTEYALILSLADMVDSATREWRTTWTDLAIRSRWPIRTLKHAGYRLRDARWMQIRSTGHGIVITLTPDSGVSLRVSGVQPIAQQKGNPSPTRKATVYTPVGQPVAHIDSPPHTPPGANAPKTPSPEAKRRDGGTQKRKGDDRPASPPLQAAPEKNGRLSTSQVINSERELKRVEAGIKTLDGSYSDHQDWEPDDRARYRELKARRKELMTALGWKA